MDFDEVAKEDQKRLLQERIKECEWWPAVIVGSAMSSLVLTGVWMLLEGKLIPGLPGFGPLPLRSFFLGLFDRVFVGGIVLIAVGTFGAIAKGLYNERNRQAEMKRRPNRRLSTSRN